MDSIKYTIVGAGIIGLQTALELINQNIPAEDIAIFEQNRFPGEHASSRNSGVLHAGIYYPETSLKQKYCVEGNLLWRDLSKEIGFSINEIGKFIVATTDQEIAELDRIYNLCKKKKLAGISWADHRPLQDSINVEKALFSKTTAMIDCADVIKKISDHLIGKGVNFLMSQKVDVSYKKNNFIINVMNEKFKTDYLINTAGLFSVELRNQLGLTNIKNDFVKGSYLSLTKNYYNDSLIYPIPDDDLKGLGIHTIVQFDGSILFGPDTESVKEIDYRMNESLISEIYQGIKKTFKNIRKEELSLAYSGIRAKISVDGEKYDDFLIQNPLPHYVEALGIESPGITAAPAIAKSICQSLL